MELLRGGASRGTPGVAPGATQLRRGCEVNSVNDDIKIDD